MRDDEKIFLLFVKKGVFRVFENGEIYRCKTKHGFPYKYKDCEPRLIRTENNGYIWIQYWYRGKRIRVHGHRLVWTYFNGEIPLGKETNHKNGIRNDNRLENLEIITHRENTLHALNILKREFGVKGEDCTFSKLKEEDIKEIRRLRSEENMSQFQISKIFSVSEQNIGHIVNRKTWTWLD